MEENEISVEQGFYEECAKLLDCAEHTYRKFPYRKRTRWNNRTAGNGRFPGHGLVRMFSHNLITVSLYQPKCRGTFATADAALAAIKLALEQPA